MITNGRLSGTKDDLASNTATITEATTAAEAVYIVANTGATKDAAGLYLLFQQTFITLIYPQCSQRCSNQNG